MSTTNSQESVPVVKCVIPQIDEYQFTMLTFTEKLGGELPTAHLSFLQAEDTDSLSIDELDLNIALNEDELNFHAFVDSATNHRGDNQWDLTLVPKEFYQESHTDKFSGVNALINSLNPYKLLSDINSDCNLDGVDLYQNAVTDYRMLTQYLTALKAKQSFSYRVDGLYIADLTKSPTEKIDIRGFQRELSLRVDRSKFENLKVDLTSDTENNIVNLHYNNSIHSEAKDLGIAAKNYLENQFLIQSLPNKLPFEFPTFMNLRAGDLVKLTGNNYEENNYVVVTNTVQLSVGKVLNSITFATI